MSISIIRTTKTTTPISWIRRPTRGAGNPSWSKRVVTSCAAKWMGSVQKLMNAPVHKEKAGRFSFQPFGFSDRLNPFKHAFSPGIHQARDQDQDEDYSLEDCINVKASKRDRPRKEEDRLYIENQKYQCKNIILGFELHPAVSDSFHAAFIRTLLDGIGLFR